MASLKESPVSSGRVRAGGMHDSTVRESMFTMWSSRISRRIWLSVSQQKSSSSGTSSSVSTTMFRFRLCRNHEPCSDCSPSNSTRAREPGRKYSMYLVPAPPCTCM